MNRGLVVAALVLAAGCVRQSAATPSAAARPDVLEGVVVGLVGDELVVDEGSPGGPCAEVRVDPATQWVGLGGTTIDPRALDEGDRVRVFYNPLSAHLQVASRVEITGEARPGKPAPAPDSMGPEALRPDVVPDPLP